jgi:enterochelin esterase-like enzyme
MLWIILAFCLIQTDGLTFEQFTNELKALPISERGSVVQKYVADHPVTPIIEQDSLVGFYWLGKAHSVVINGDLQLGWSRPDTLEPIPCVDDTLFVRTYTIPPDARLDYQLIVDGKTTTDPHNPRITPSGFGLHSEIAMPRFKPNPIRALRRDVPHGSIDSLMFSSRDPLIKPRKVKVYRPPGYEHLSGLSTLYVHDGLEALVWMDYSTVLDNLIEDKRIEPLLVVFVPPVERDLEYLWGRYRQFITALCDELVPLIDRTYKTAHRPEKRAMAGISNGGHLSLITVFKRPDTFLCAAGQSSTITDQLFEALACALKDEKTRLSLRIYLDVGRYDLRNGPTEEFTFLRTNETLHQMMEEHGLKTVFHEFNDGHEWANWRERTGEILEFFFGTK